MLHSVGYINDILLITTREKWKDFFAVEFHKYFGKILAAKYDVRWGSIINYIMHSWPFKCTLASRRLETFW